MNTPLILITIYLFRLIYEAGTVSILINQLTRIFEIGKLHDNERGWLQYIDEEDTEREG